MPALVSHHGIWPWIWFNVFVVAMLAIDLGIVHRKKHAVSLKEALAWTGVWVSLALLFALMLFLWSEELGLVAYARDGTPMSEARTAVDFLTAYLIEESLSMDNIFVFLLVFRYFNIPSEYQHKVLFWGILGAVVMRLTFILTGVALLKHVEWVGYIFGGILIFTGVKLWRQGEQEIHPDRNPMLRLLRRFVPIYDDLADGQFIIKRNGRRFASRLLVTLIVIETTDVIFAVDSVPAVLSVTTDEFIAYSSNVFAILGLRALYFALAGVVPLFKDLHYGLSFILIFVGGKMVAERFVHLPESMPWISLGVVASVLVLTVLTSILRHRKAVAVALDQIPTQQEGEGEGQGQDGSTQNQASASYETRESQPG